MDQTEQKLSRADVRDEQEALEALRAEASPEDQAYLDQEDERIKQAAASLGQKTIEVVMTPNGVATKAEVDAMRAQGQDLSGGAYGNGRRA